MVEFWDNFWHLILVIFGVNVRGNVVNVDLWVELFADFGESYYSWVLLGKVMEDVLGGEESYGHFLRSFSKCFLRTS